jgi:hypothetical protein
MTNNKQSSVVDFIYNELFVVKRWMDLTPGDIEYIFKQAKAMHKEEMITTWHKGYDNLSPMIDENNCGDKYYNETFGGQDANI